MAAAGIRVFSPAGKHSAVNFAEGEQYEQNYRCIIHHCVDGRVGICIRTLDAMRTVWQQVASFNKGDVKTALADCRAVRRSGNIAATDVLSGLHQRCARIWLPETKG
jgi:hypothetical protein